MQAPLLRRINQLPSVANPKATLSGAYMVWDVPLGPVAGAYRTMRGTAEQLAEYLGQLTAYNAMPSLRKAVEYRTNAERNAARPGDTSSSTMEELDPLSMCLGTEIYVSNDPSGQHEYKVVYNLSGPLLVWVDGDFAQSVRGKIQAEIVPNAGQGGGAGGRTLSAVTLNVDAQVGNKYQLSPDLVEVVAALIAAGKKPVWILPDAGAAARTTVNMRATYGVLADQSTDNKDALLAFRDAYKGQGKGTVKIQFEDGAVMTSNNRWIHNVRSLEMIGGPHGTSLMIIPLGNEHDYDWFYQRPMLGGDPFTINIYQVGNIPPYTGTVRRPPAPRFKSAAKGATSITLVDVADAALFAAGNRVLLFGYDQIGGKSYPPGTRYNDWKVVTAVNATTGVLTLNAGLKYAYDERWHDVVDEYDDLDGRGNSGKPRLVNLDRDDFIYPERLVFDRINWAINPAYPVDERKVSATFIPIGDTVIARNGRIEGDMDASLSRIVVLDNMRQVPGQGKTDNEVDKLMQKLLILGGSYTDYTSNGTSCDEVAMRGATMLNSVALCPRRYLYEGMTFTADKTPTIYDPALGVPPAGSPIELGVIKPATFIQKEGNLASSAYEPFNRHEYTVEAAEGQNIILPANHSTEDLPQSRMELGRTILSTPTGSKRMRLESAWQDDQGRFVMTVSGAVPAVGDVLAWSSVSKVIDYGSHTLQGFARRRGETGLLRGGAPDSPAGQTRAKLDLLDFDLGGRDLTADLRSSLVSFTCHVDTPYTGTEGPLKLEFYSNRGTYESIASINLSVAGTRTVTASAATGQQAGDTLRPAQFGPDVFHNKIQVILRGSNGSSGLLNRDPALLPIIRVVVDSLDVEVVDITNVPDFTYENPFS